MNKLRFYIFNLMPYPHIPPASEIQSTWVSLSNKYYDPHRGQALYKEYIDQLAAAEQFGFDGVAVNEHHANFYGTMPSPNMFGRRSSASRGWLEVVRTRSSRSMDSFFMIA